MGVAVFWDNEAKTCLRLDFEGPWRWDEYDSAIAEASASIESAGYRVDLIHNLQAGSRMPLGYFLPHFRYALNLMKANLGFIVFVGSNHSMQVLLSLFIETFTTVHHKVAFADSVDDARRILADRRQKVSTI